MAKWSFPVELEHYADAEEDSIKGWACKIVIKFTQGLWVIFNPDWMKSRSLEVQRIKAITREEALTCWSMDFICEKMENVKFCPCNFWFWRSFRLAFTFVSKRISLETFFADASLANTVLNDKNKNFSICNLRGRMSSLLW